MMYPEPSKATLRARRHQRGFTLIEMAVVLVIAGLLIGMLAPLLGQVLENNRTAATTAHLNTIEEALVVFVRANGRIPCPALPNATPLGTETGNCNGNNDDGIVPYRTLGLSEDVARDGYKNFFTYHVAEQYADTGLNPDITVGFCTQNQTLTVQDASSGDLAPGQEVVYVLVSHGENGFGHYSPPGANQVNDNGGTHESENTDDDDVYVQTTPLAAGVTGGPYDDTIRWRTRDQIGNDVQEFGCS